MEELAKDMQIAKHRQMGAKSLAEFELTETAVSSQVAVTREATFLGQATTDFSREERSGRKVTLPAHYRVCQF